MIVLMTLLTGVVAGILSGLLGVGGGIVLVPMMVFGLGMAQHIAQGISLLVIIPTAFAGIWQLQKQKLVNYHVAVYLSVGAVAGGIISANFVQDIPAADLKKIFGLFIIIMGSRMLLAKPKKSAKTSS
ncbi:MAG: sulfite exporter TauE/SafE family protein [Veillonellales bacterium]